MWSAGTAGAGTGLAYAWSSHWHMDRRMDTWDRQRIWRHRTWPLYLLRDTGSPAKGGGDALFRLSRVLRVVDLC